MGITDHRARVNIRASYISMWGHSSPFFPVLGEQIGPGPAHGSGEPAVWTLAVKNKMLGGFMLLELKGQTELRLQRPYAFRIRSPQG